MTNLRCVDLQSWPKIEPSHALAFCAAMNMRLVTDWHRGALALQIQYLIELPSPE